MFTERDRSDRRCQDLQECQGAAFRTFPLLLEAGLVPRGWGGLHGATSHSLPSREAKTERFLFESSAPAWTERRQLAKPRALSLPASLLAGSLPRSLVRVPFRLLAGF